MRSRVIGLILLALLPALTVVLFSARRDLDRERHDAIESTNRLIDTVVAEHAQLVAQTEHLLVALDTVPAIGSLDPARCTPQLVSTLRHYPRYANLSLARRQGTLLCSALRAPEGVTVADRHYFQDAVRTQRLSIGEYQIDRVTGRATLNVAYPIVDRDVVRAVLIAAIDLEWLNTLAGLLAPPGSTVAVLDRQGVILARSPGTGSRVGEVLADSSLLLRTMNEGQGRGALTIVGPDGIERLYRVAPLIGGDRAHSVSVAVGVPTAVAFARVHERFASVLLSLSLAAFLAIVVAGLASEALVLHPIRRLVAAARQLGAGDLNVRSRVGGARGEIGTLARAFDQMVESLARKQAEVEQAWTAERAQRGRAEAMYAASERRLHHLQALREIDRAITSSVDLTVTLHVALEQVVTELGVDAAAVLILNPRTLILEFASGRGFKTPALRYSRLRMGDGYAGTAALERRVVSVPDLTSSENGFGKGHHLAEEAFVAYSAAPLLAKGEVKGVLEIFHRMPLEQSSEWLGLLDTLAGQVAIAVDNAHLFSDLQRTNTQLILAYDRTLEGWSRALDLRDHETEGHSERVTEMTMRLARAMGTSEDDLVHVRRGALLHDIGKMGIPDRILQKPGPLTPDERATMERHPTYAFDLLMPIAHLRPALDIPYCHHERWDGTGYPRGLRGDQIPFAARLFAVVDVWDGLCSDRPYRRGWSEVKVLEYIQGEVGSHFDPQVVDVFLRLATPGSHSQLLAPRT